MIGNDEPEVSEPGQVIAQGDWYDYESKYTAGGMELVVPAPISPAQRERVRRIAQDAFLRSSCAGLARVDFFVTDEGQVLLNELNTIPGLHDHERVRAPVRSVGRAVRGAAGPAAGVRGRAVRARAGALLLVPANCGLRTAH